jgi:hypothetical protein
MGRLGMVRCGTCYGWEGLSIVGRSLEDKGFGFIIGNIFNGKEEGLSNDGDFSSPGSFSFGSVCLLYDC